jgi:hypothetical protein
MSELRIDLKDERYRSSNQSDKSGDPSIKRSMAAADRSTVTFPKKGELPISRLFLADIGLSLIFPNGL